MTITNELETLRRQLLGLDGRGYKAYRAITGRYRHPAFTLHVDHVQGDPFAAPSRLRVILPADQAALPADLYANPSRRTGLENGLNLAFSRALSRFADRSGSGKSGDLAISTPGQQLLQRSALTVQDGIVEARFTAGLPARGRRILGRAAAALLCDALPSAVAAGLQAANRDVALLSRFAAAAEDGDALRAALAQRGLVAFVAAGSRLPRRSGVDDRPLSGDAVVPFQPPPSLTVEVDLPNRGWVRGLGIPAGVTLVVGGGFHGKSTLLNALARAVYNHRPDDGRELVATTSAAVTIRAEDGRAVSGVDISPFIDNLPQGRDTRRFTTPNASGSTSQAANILEALALGADLLLVDEDTAATNFMIRDRRMRALIPDVREPITPFIDRVRQLYEEKGVSTILVVGGSGAYFDVADQVIAMDAYVPRDVTAEARAAADRLPAGERPAPAAWPAAPSRLVQPAGLSPARGRRSTYIRTRGRQTLQYGEEIIDLGAVAQLLDEDQTRAIGSALAYAFHRYVDGSRSVADIVRLVADDVATYGLDCLDDRRPGNLAYFRPHELGAALNRLRSLTVVSAAG